MYAHTLPYHECVWGQIIQLLLWQHFLRAQCSHTNTSTCWHRRHPLLQTASQRHTHAHIIIHTIEESTAILSDAGEVCLAQSDVHTGVCLHDGELYARLLNITHVLHVNALFKHIWRINILTPSHIRIAIVIRATLTQNPPTLTFRADTPNMWCLWCNKRTYSIKTAQTQLDLTSDNTPIHHHAHGDSTSLHSDSSEQSTHTYTHAVVLKRAQTHTIQLPMSASPPICVLCVCVCARESVIVSYIIHLHARTWKKCPW